MFVEQLGYTGSVNKQDRVGPVDNRPSAGELHHFVNLFKNIFFLNILFKFLIFLVTCQTGHMTGDT